MDKKLRWQILRLLLRSHDQIKVEIRPSEVAGIASKKNSSKLITTATQHHHHHGDLDSKNLHNHIKESAGMGVFTTVDSIQRGDALCLYPGIYSPGIPPGISAEWQIDDTLMYFGDTSTPSGIDVNNNKYLINVKTISGGYIDGSALCASTNDNNTIQQNHEHTEKKTRHLDKNPGACGHKINHSAVYDNVIPISFNWDDIFVQSNNNDECQTKMKLDNNLYYELPNIVRCDGDIRYISGPVTIRYNGDGPNCGIVFCAKETIPNRGTELLLNYQLKYPYPNWAKSWYTTTS